MEKTAECRRDTGRESQYVMKVENPELWSAESPVLYDLLLEVMDENGQVTEVILREWASVVLR